MIKPRHLWIFGGLLLLSGLLAPMASFAEGEPVPYAHNDNLLYDRSDNSAGIIHRFTMLGFPPAKGLSKSPTLSLFERVASAEESSHRLFQLYRYRHDLANDETDFDVLLLYRHDRDAARTVYDLLPLYGYRTESSGDTQGSAIGPLPFVRSTDWSHHEHPTSPTTEPDRFDPGYQYSHDERTGQSIINVLDRESVSLFRARRRISQSFQNPLPPYNYLADYPAGTNSLTETVLIISARVVLGILSHQLRVEQASLPRLTF